MLDRCALALALMVCAVPADALTIRELESQGDIRVLALDGKFEPRDDKRFLDFIIGFERAVIVLNSPGGRLEPAIEIGSTIRKRKFATLVHDGASCASACALVWLAGVSRAMGQSAKLGFHSAHTIKSGLPLRSDAGNAKVGAYLATLKLSDRVVRYVTEPAPHDFNWLDFERAESLEVLVKRTSPPDPILQTSPSRDGNRFAPSTRPRLLQTAPCRDAWECWEKYGGQAPELLVDLVAAYARELVRP
jgi:hypothetical protein